MNKELFNTLLDKHWEDALETVKEVIRLTKSSGKQNEQKYLDFIDELNRLSIEY